MPNPESFRNIYGAFAGQMNDNWDIFLANLDKSLAEVEKEIGEAKTMTTKCTGEWCEATEHVIDDLQHMVFSIHEPRFIDEAHSNKLKELKKRVRNLYTDFMAAQA